MGVAIKAQILWEARASLEGHQTFKRSSTSATGLKDAGRRSGERGRGCRAPPGCRTPARRAATHLPWAELAVPPTSWALRLMLAAGGPMPGPVGWGTLGEPGAAPLMVLGYGRPPTASPGLRPTGPELHVCPGPWPCIGLLAFRPKLLVMPGPGPL